MSVKGEQLRLGVFAVVLGLACVNALALWGIEPARWGYTALQACTGAAAMVFAAVVAFRNHGVARLWRLLVFAATTSWLIGELFWYFGRAPEGGTAPPIAVAAYLLPPVISLGALVLLAISAGGVSTDPDGPLRVRDPSRSSTGWWPPHRSRSWF